MSELLLELFSEEIPAMMQKPAEEAYRQIFTKSFKENNIPFDDIEVFVGPRRVTIYAKGLPKTISAKEVEVRGPKVGASKDAIEGFLKSLNNRHSGLDPESHEILNQVQGDSCLNQVQHDKGLTQKLIKDQLYYVYIQKTKETSITDLLAQILPQAIAEYSWPKSMYWGDYNIKWARPLKNILCLFDGEILPIKFGHLIANDITYGHRFMAPDPIKITSFADYKDKLKNNYVILTHQDRKTIIEQQLLATAKAHNLTIKEDKRLLEEVAGIVEYPTVMIGTIPEKFLKIPSEALIASMRTHQKYFSLFDNDGNFAPYFLFVANINSSDSQIIISGNEKVLSARLSDALYFYSQDLTHRLESKLPKLDKVVFHAKLGSIKAKTDRLAKICEYLAPNDQSLQIAAKLCKSDLTSEMVGEFPELQGIMGYYYALHEGLGDEVSIAIRDHYRPQGPSDSMPQGSAAILSLADKVDSLVGLMIAGEHATGSKDPYGLRRQALGIIRIIMENKLYFDIKELIAFVVGLYNCHCERTPSVSEQERGNPVFNNTLTDYSGLPRSLTLPRNDGANILLFLEERAKFFFKNEYDISLVNSLLDLDSDGDLTILETKLEILKNFLASNEGANVLMAYKRVSNILGTEEIKGAVNPEYFKSDYERELFDKLAVSSDKITKKDFISSLNVLSTLFTPISNFFDNIMVKDADAKIATNRLALLRDVKQLFNFVAKFDYL